MKLYHRTDFWGSRITGRHTLTHLGINARIIHAQAILPEFNLPHWGCCKNSGKRVVEVKEQHFLEHSRGTWDLYLMNNRRKRRTKNGEKSVYIYEFCVMPSSSNFISLPSWHHIGVVNPCMARMDLNFFLYPILCKNIPNELPKHHVHIVLVMDSLLQTDFKLVCANAAQRRAAYAASALQNVSSSEYLCVAVERVIISRFI